MFEPIDQITLARCHRDDLARELARRTLLRSFPRQPLGRASREALGRAMIRAGETLAGLPHRAPAPEATRPAMAASR
ncbi:MAG: hypothetical protein M3462_12825 [Chloroflexota bacterium]|nr:hypothetical protein [Chloroflexota bacterium]